MMTLDDLARSIGLQHIVINVLSHLDPKKMVQCRALSTQFKNLIDNSKYLMLLQIKHAFSVRNSKLSPYIIEQELKHCTESSNHALKALERSLGKIDKNSCEILLNFMKNIWLYPFSNMETQIMKLDTSQRLHVRSSSRLRNIMRNDICMEKLMRMDILQYAIVCNHVEIVDILLSYSIAVSKNNMDMDFPISLSPFFTACRFGQLEIVQLLLEYHKKEKILQFNSSYQFGPKDTVFYLASQNGHTEVVKALLDFSIKNGNEIDLNATDSDTTALGTTALHNACKYGHLETAEAILQHQFDYGGIDINPVTLRGDTPFVYACKNSEMLPVVKTYLKLAMENQDIVLDLANEYTTNHKTGAVNWVYPLHYACWQGSVEIVKALLDSRLFDVNRRSTKGHTALWMACKKNKVDVVKLLLETPDVDRDIPDFKGRTPLDIAISLNLDEIEELLRNAYIIAFFVTPFDTLSFNL